MPTVLVDFSIFPVDKGESLSRYVSQALDIVDKSGLPYRLGPMSTTIEGEYTECMQVVNSCFEALQQESNRVLMQLKVDYRSGREGALKSKTAAIENHLGRKLCT